MRNAHNRLVPFCQIALRRSATTAAAARRPYDIWRTPPVDSNISADSEFTRDPPLQRLEAVLLIAREPVNSRKLAFLANLADGTRARTLVRTLNRIYDESGRAFRVEEIAGGFQLLTRPKFSDWLRRLPHVPPETRLSAPAMETLSVVAYRQPVLRADVEAIRGVNCGEILRQLMERDLVRISGRSEELGRPYLYSTTKKFLTVFGLSSVDKLPHVETMRFPVVPPEPVEAATSAEAATPTDIVADLQQEDSEVMLTQAVADQDVHPEDENSTGEPPVNSQTHIDPSAAVLDEQDDAPTPDPNHVLPSVDADDDLDEHDDEDDLDDDDVAEEEDDEDDDEDVDDKKDDDVDEDHEDEDYDYEYDDEDDDFDDDDEDFDDDEDDDDEDDDDFDDQWEEVKDDDDEEEDDDDDDDDFEDDDDDEDDDVKDVGKDAEEDDEDDDDDDEDDEEDDDEEEWDEDDDDDVTEDADEEEEEE